MKAILRTVGLFVLALAVCGCGRDNVAREVAAMNASNLKRVANMYAAYQNYRGTGPTDEADFKAFIKGFMPKNLEMMGIDPNNVDKIFTSERDSKPFKIRYRVAGGRGSVDPVVFEQEGQGGKKQVGFTGGRVDEADDATYQALWAGRFERPTGGERPSGPPAGVPKGPPKK